MFKEYKGYSFVGSEADIAIVLIEKYYDTSSSGVFSQREQIIHQVSKARKLLIICSYSNELDNFMENSVELRLATQIDFRKYKICVDTVGRHCNCCYISMTTVVRLNLVWLP